MSTAIDNRHPAGSLSLRRLVTRHSVAAFPVMAYTVGWTIGRGARRAPHARSALAHARARRATCGRGGGSGDPAERAFTSTLGRLPRRNNSRTRSASAWRLAGAGALRLDHDIRSLPLSALPNGG
jgi:hypothetical protein